MNRRALLQGLCGAALPIRCRGEELPPVRAITRPPKYHWFGYYDKLQCDPSGRFALCLEVDFEHRSPRPDDVARVGMVDTANGDRWIELGESRAWNWQQGCMLQWLPGSSTEVIWNDREGSRFVSHVLDVKTQKRRTLPAPVYAVDPSSRWAVSTDFSRLHDCRPGYGYAGVPDPAAAVPAPADSGVWRLDLKTGERKLIITVAEIVERSAQNEDRTRVKHWFNHLLFAPDGRRFIFLHRWVSPQSRSGRGGRMYTSDLEGKQIHQFPGVSHFNWRGHRHILAWSNRPPLGEKFYLFEDGTGRFEAVAPEAMTEDGHCTYSRDHRWILCDTYPDAGRRQNPYLYDTRTRRRHFLGHFHSPAEYTGEWRCDLHPRFTPGCRQVLIDSPHGGNGRQLYLIDASSLVV